MPTVPPMEALKIQVRAVLAEDNCLAQAALDRAAQDRFPSEVSYPVLEHMRTRDLLKLVSICDLNSPRVVAVLLMYESCAAPRSTAASDQYLLMHSASSKVSHNSVRQGLNQIGRRGRSTWMKCVRIWQPCLPGCLSASCHPE